MIMFLFVKAIFPISAPESVLDVILAHVGLGKVMDFRRERIVHL
jgi:hypothetical protein